MKITNIINYRKLLVLTVIVLSGAINLSFSQWIQTGLDGYYIRTITSTGSALFSGTSGDGLYISTNNGIAWSQLNAGLIGLEFPAFTVSGSSLYAGSEGWGVFASVNNGTSWSSLAALPNPNVFALAVSGINLYAGVDGGGVFRSTNNGSSWTNSTSGMTNTRITSLAVSGSNLFAGTFGGGIFLSANNGLNWTAVNNGLTNTDVWTVNTAASYPGYIFAGTGNGAFYSTNNGAVWVAFNNGLTDTYVHTFAFSGASIFAGTDNAGVFRTISPGSAWVPMNDGLTNTTVWILTAAGSNLYAGTNGSGIFKRPLSEMVPVNGNSQEIPANFSISQNYPNPFNPSTKIKVDLVKSGNVNISVYDVSGKKIEELVNNLYNAGTFEVTFNAVKYSSGVYFYKIETADYSETRKMMLIK